MNKFTKFFKVAYEMDMVLRTDNTQSSFEHLWNNYACHILHYTVAHSLQSKEVQELLKPLFDDDLPNNQSGFEFETGMYKSKIWATLLFSFMLQKILLIFTASVH